MREEASHIPHRANTVLVIAYYFPPMGLSGVQRTMKFVKYLSQYGWRPIVLTTPEDTPYYAFDETLMNELDEEIRAGNVIVYRTESDPSIKRAQKNGRLMKLPRQRWQQLRTKLVQIIRQPDSRIGWKDIALKTAEQIFEEHHIDAVFTTAPPYTDFLIARELQDRYNVPYLIDYRDGWVDNPVLNFYLTRFHKKKARQLEYEVLRASSAITTANRRMKEILLENYLFLDWNDVTILPQGYDAEDIERAIPLAAALKQPEVFRLTYAGAFYVGRSPKSLFEAVRLAITENPGLEQSIELNFVGVLQKEYRKLAKKLKLEHLLAEQGYLPHLESVAHLLASDVLWMTMSDDLSAPGKLYEYFGTHKPILGLVPKQSHTERQLLEYGNALLAEPDDVQAIKNAILEFYSRWRSGKLDRTVDDSFVHRFDRSAITKELATQLTFMSGSLDGEIKKLRRKY